MASLRRWVEDKLNSKHYQGLTWLDKKEGTFKISWHRAKDIQEDMKPIVFQVFVDWGYFSNRATYKSRENPNFSQFKRNMRCALNKQGSGFERLCDNSDLEGDPHLIYKFTNFTPSQESLLSHPSIHWNTVNINEARFQDENIPEHVHDFYSQLQNNMVQRENYSMGDSHRQVFSQHFSFMNRCDASQSSASHFPEIGQVSSFSNTGHQEMNCERPPSPKLPSDIEVLGFDALIEPQDSADFPMYGGNSLNTPVMSLDFVPECEQTNSISNTCIQDIYCDTHLPPKLSRESEMLSSGYLIDPQNSKLLLMNGMSNRQVQETSPSNDALSRQIECQNNSFVAKRHHEMNVRVSYGQPPEVIMNKTVGENGCRLHTKNRLLANTIFEEEAYGSEDVTDIMLPDVYQNITSHSNAKQAGLITNLLRAMERGITLTFVNGDIYAQRFSRSRVYFCDANFNSICLDRKSKVPVKVFDFKEFMSKLDDYCSSPESQPKLPPAHFYLTVGVKVDPGHEVGPLSQVLISVCVTHKAAEELKKEAILSKGARGESLLFFYSDLDSTDRWIDMLKDLPTMP